MLSNEDLIAKIRNGFVVETVEDMSEDYLKILIQTKSKAGFTASTPSYTGYPALGREKYGKIWFDRYGRLFGEILRRYGRGEDVFDDLAIDHLVDPRRVGG